MIRLVVCLIGYLFGCIQTSFFLGKSRGIDIREHGSGNAGTTNALRVMGPRAGVLVFIGDCGKMILAALLTWLLFSRSQPQLVLLVKLYTGIGVVLGHDFPFFMKGKGGKGIAVTGGLMLILDWRLGIVALAVFLGVTFATKLVSLGSCLMTVLCYALFIVMGECGLVEFGALPKWEAWLILGLWVALALVRHKDNIRRLLSGTENRLDLFAKKS